MGLTQDNVPGVPTSADDRTVTYPVTAGAVPPATRIDVIQEFKVRVRDSGGQKCLSIQNRRFSFLTISRLEVCRSI